MWLRSVNWAVLSNLLCQESPSGSGGLAGKYSMFWWPVCCSCLWAALHHIITTVAPHLWEQLRLFCWSSAFLHWSCCGLMWLGTMQFTCPPHSPPNCGKGRELKKVARGHCKNLGLRWGQFNRKEMGEGRQQQQQMMYRAVAPWLVPSP